MTKLKVLVVALVSALAAGAVVCCASTSPSVKRIEAVACQDVDALEALAVSIETAAGAKPEVIASTHTGFAALRAACAAMPGPGSQS